MDFWEWWGKYGNFIVGVSILLFVVVGWTMMYQDRQIKNTIQETCGWGEEDYYCFCEKSEAMRVKNIIEGEEFDFNLTNLTVTTP